MIKKIGIFGSGQIGKSLATLFSGLGLNVVLYCRNKERTSKEVSTATRIAKKLNLGFDFSNNEIMFTNNLSDLNGLDLVIECVTENIDTKMECLCMLSKALDEHTIIGTTTSTNSISKLSATLKHDNNFIGLHFFNPPSLIHFLEIIRSKNTSTETMNEICNFFDSIKFKYVVLKRDNPGFIVNRALFLMLNEAIYELEEGVATAQEIDFAFINGLNYPMGPIELCDFIGLDVVLEILQTLEKEYGSEKYKPSNLLVGKVQTGHLGKKTKKGFFFYK